LHDEEYQAYLDGLTEDEKALIKENKHYYTLSFSNKGGLIMPLIIQFKYEDGTDEVVRLPAEIWRFGDTVTKAFVLDKKVDDIVLDPYLETADVDVSNNSFKPKASPDRFELFKNKYGRRSYNRGENPMQRANKIKEKNKNVQQP